MTIITNKIERIFIITNVDTQEVSIMHLADFNAEYHRIHTEAQKNGQRIKLQHIWNGKLTQINLSEIIDMQLATTPTEKWVRIDSLIGYGQRQLDGGYKATVRAVLGDLKTHVKDMTYTQFRQYKALIK